jgi:hypothetical protein
MLEGPTLYSMVLYRPGRINRMPELSRTRRDIPGRCAMGS